MKKVTRVAFDFGSGATKMCLAEVTVNTKTGLAADVKVHYQQEAEVLLGHSFKESPDGSVDAAMTAKLFRVVEGYTKIIKEKADPRLPVEVCAVATAVFREAKNGAEIVSALKNKYNIPLSRVSQAEEGKIGFLTGVESVRCSGGHLPEKVVVWDSGGSSFQLTCGAVPRPDERVGALNVFEGPWGSSKATHLMVSDVQRKTFKRGVTANPVTSDDVDKALRLFAKAHSKYKTPTWIDGAKIIGIGGPTCAFRCTSLTCKKTKDITPADVEMAIATYSNKTDAELHDAGLPQPAMVIPKLCLVLSVMRRFLIPSFDFHQTTGGTLGMIVDPDRWPATTPAKL